MFLTALKKKRWQHIFDCKSFDNTHFILIQNVNILTYFNPLWTILTFLISMPFLNLFKHKFYGFSTLAPLLLKSVSVNTTRYSVSNLAILSST